MSGQHESTRTQQPPLRLAALFVGDRSHEFGSLARGEVPTHRLLGIADLERLGHEIAFVRRRRDRRILPYSISWRLYQVCWVFRRQRATDVFIATHEAAALPALMLRRIGLLRRPVLVMTVAATGADYRAGARGWAKRWALRGADTLTVFSSAQVTLLAEVLGVPDARVRFLRLGVDVDFFSPLEETRDAGILAVGTNEGKDHPTLVRALPLGVPCTIVTDSRNRDAGLAAVDGKDVTFLSDIPILRLREMYATAQVLVIPLREVDISSGQTVLLENLAMNTPTIVSDVAHIRDYAVAEAVRLVPAGDVEGMSKAINDVLACSGSYDGAGRRFVLSGFTAREMGQALDGMVRSLAQRGSR